MATPSNTLQVEGSFEEVATELAQYIDALKNKLSGGEEPASNTATEIAPMLDAGAKDDALKALVVSSTSLNAAPEREFLAAYNTLIYLVSQSPNPRRFWPRMCKNLSNPFPAPQVPTTPSRASAAAAAAAAANHQNNASSLALSAMTTIFNIIESQSQDRYQVFLQILALVKQHNRYDLLATQVQSMLDRWPVEWNLDEEQERDLFVQLADISEASGRENQTYDFLIKALKSFTGPSAQSQQIALRALRLAATSPTTYYFSTLAALPAVLALRQSTPAAHQFLQILLSGTLLDYRSFLQKSPTFLTSTFSEPLSESQVLSKIRMITLQDLAAKSKDRSLGYEAIAQTLQVDDEEVETYIIDCIRVGLVEGRMSQREKVFLVNGWKSRGGVNSLKKEDWVAIQERLGQWRDGLKSVLDVVKRGREEAAEMKNAAANEGQGEGGQGHQQGTVVRRGGGYGRGRGNSQMANGERNRPVAAGGD